MVHHNHKIEKISKKDLLICYKRVIGKSFDKENLKSFNKKTIIDDII
jgi:hypothetical protein